MAKQIIGVTLSTVSGQEALGVYEAEGGVEVVQTDAPYLTSALSLQSPMPVFDAGGPVFVDGMGRPQMSLPVTGLGPLPPAGITWDSNTPWDNNTYWS